MNGLCYELKKINFVMVCIFFMLIFVSWCFAQVNNPVAKVNSTDNILCRECGSPLLKSDTIIGKASAASQYSFNDTIFNRKEVLVQLLVQDIFLRYPVITSTESSCLGKGDWEEDELWFPDYVMKPCFCPECGTFVGWMFENDSPTTVHSTDEFFGLILTNLISENCNYLNSFDCDLLGLCCLSGLFPIFVCAYQNQLLSVSLMISAVEVKRYFNYVLGHINILLI